MKKKTILIVDDEICIRTAFAKLLTGAGYEVNSAESAEEALQIMRQYPPALMFSDLNLPGLNGIELCRRMRQEWPCSIAIAITGYATLFELVACREAGFDDYFLKPLSSKELLAVADGAFKRMERWKQRQSVKLAAAQAV